MTIPPRPLLMFSLRCHLFQIQALFRRVFTKPLIERGFYTAHIKILFRNMFFHFLMLACGNMWHTCSCLAFGGLPMEHRKPWAVSLLWHWTKANFLIVTSGVPFLWIFSVTYYYYYCYYYYYGITLSELRLWEYMSSRLCFYRTFSKHMDHLTHHLWVATKKVQIRILLPNAQRLFFHKLCKSPVIVLKWWFQNWADKPRIWWSRLLPMWLLAPSLAGLALGARISTCNFSYLMSASSICQYFLCCPCLGFCFGDFFAVLSWRMLSAPLFCVTVILVSYPIE